MKKRIIASIALLFMLFSFGTASSANTIIDKSTADLVPGEPEAFSRVITVPKGAWLGLYLDLRGIPTTDIWWEIYSPSGNFSVDWGRGGDFRNKIYGVPAGDYRLDLYCYSKNCDVTGILSSQYK